MRDTDLFRMALGIEPPWMVTKSEFDAAARRLDIHLDFARGSRFACPQCGIAGCSAYDSEEKTWRHLNFFQHEAYLHARVPRVTCKECGIKQVPAHCGNPRAVAEVCIDMSPAFIAGTAESLPNAQITFDKFHLVKLINEAVDEVRRSEQKSRAELKKSRYLWLKNPRNLSARQRTQLDNLSAANLKTGRAYRIRLAFQDLYGQPANNAEAFLKKWYWWATHSRLPPMIEAARMVKRHWNGILRWFHTRIANGIMEAINSLVQAAKAKARGYRSTRNLKAIIYLIAGKLELALPT